MNQTRFRKLSDKEKAFYATIAFDFELKTSVGWLELVACNYRSNYDLNQHSKISKEKMEITIRLQMKKFCLMYLSFHLE